MRGIKIIIFLMFLFSCESNIDSQRKAVDSNELQRQINELYEYKKILDGRIIELEYLTSELNLIRVNETLSDFERGISLGNGSKERLSYAVYFGDYDLTGKVIELNNCILEFRGKVFYNGFQINTAQALRQGYFKKLYKTDRFIINEN